MYKVLVAVPVNVAEQVKLSSTPASKSIDVTKASPCQRLTFVGSW